MVFDVLLICIFVVFGYFVCEVILYVVGRSIFSKFVLIFLLVIFLVIFLVVMIIF